MAFGVSTLSNIGGAVNDLFAADAHTTKAKGLRIEANNYDDASGYASEEARFAETSTAIKQAQTDRDIYKTIGGQAADVAGAGFAASGSAIDLMRESASQGALTKAVGQQQGLITEEGYEVQAKNYTRMGEAARLAASSEDEASTAAKWSAGFKFATAAFSIFDPGGGGGGGPMTLGGPGGPTPFS